MITTLSMRHAYIGPLNGGSGGGGGVFLITKMSYICILQCMSASYMFNDDKVKLYFWWEFNEIL